MCKEKSSTASVDTICTLDKMACQEFSCAEVSSGVDESRSSETLTYKSGGLSSKVTMEKECKLPTTRTSSLPLTDLRSDFLALESSGKGTGIQNLKPKPSRSGIDGLEHLSKLLGVMERMEELKEANQQLQHKCAFLEETKMLLKIQNSHLLMSQSPEEPRKTRRTKTPQRKGSAVVGSRRLSGHRRNSADGRRRRSLEKMHQQRSQSADSICKVVDLDLSQIEVKTCSGDKAEDIAGKDKELRMLRTSEERRSLKLHEKWKQVKKVFSGRSEVVGRTEHGAVSAELLLRTNSRRNSRSSTQSFKNRSQSISGECPSVKLNKNNLLSPVKQNVLLDKELSEPRSLRTPSIVLADDPIDSTKPRSGSLQLSSIASDSLSKNSCSEIPEGGSVLSPEDESDDSAFTPWVQQTPKRRQSSPLVRVSQSPGSSTTTNRLLSVDSTNVHLLGRSSSFKVSKAAPEVGDEGAASKSLPSTPIEPTQTSADSNQAGRTLHLPDAVGRTTKKAWGKVKGIIHTRRESLKSKSGRADDDLDDVKEEMQRGHPSGEPGPTNTSAGTHKLTSRKLSVTPNLSMRFAFFKNADTSPQSSLPTSAGGKRYSLSSAVVSSGSPVDLAVLFGVNDEFTKKMQEWEEKKKKNITKSSTKFSDDFIRKMEEWEQKKGLGGCKPGGMDGSSPCRMSPEGSGNPQSPPSGEEIQRFLSESFSRTVQDWEEVRRRHSESKEKEKERSKKVRSVSRERDKSQQRVEKELKKIQKKEQKLEHELRKLAELRLKFDLKLENSSASEKVAPDGRVSHEVVKNEVWSSTKNDHSTKDPADKSKSQDSRLRKERSSCRGREEVQWLSDGACTAPASPSTGSGQRRSASLSQLSLDSLSSLESQSLGNAELARSRGGSLGSRRRRHSGGGQSSSYQITLSSPGSRSRFKTKAQQGSALTSTTEEELRRRVDAKEDEVAALKNEVHQLTNQINNLNKIYNETIEHFQRELCSSSRQDQRVIQSDEVSLVLSQLTNRLDLLQQHGDRMAKEISQTQKKIGKEANSRRQTEQQLLHNLEQLHWIIESRTASSSLAEVVIHLCSYVTKLLSKASILRQCINERNLLIQELERHLLVQEVINKLLQADIERHAIELSHLKEFQRLAVIKRWKTFNGSDFLGREELFQTSEMSRSQERVSPKIPQSCKKVQTLLTQMINDPESPDVDTDWLTAIKKDAQLALNLVTRGMQTDCFTALPMTNATNASVQTVMTFCDCDYVPAQLPSPSEPFRCISTSASPQPPSGFNASNLDKRFLFPDVYVHEGDNTIINYKPRKSSAPDFSTDVGDNPVWLRSSAFRAISSSYSDCIQHLDGQLLPHNKGSNAHPKMVRVSFDNTTNCRALLAGVPSAKTIKQFKTDDHVEPRESEDKNTWTVLIGNSNETSLPQNLAITARLCKSSAHSPVIQSKCPRKLKGANAQLNQCQEVEGRSPKTTPLRQSFVHQRACNVERYSVVEEEETSGETDVVFSNSEDRFSWGGNMAQLKETRIDDSYCDIPLQSEGQGQTQSTSVTTSEHSLGMPQPMDQSGVGSWSSYQDLEKPGASTTRPIVVRKLKSATELLHGYGKKQVILQPTSVPQERRGSDRNTLCTKGVLDTVQTERRTTGNCEQSPTDDVSLSSLDSIDRETLSRRSEGSLDSSIGSAAKRYTCHSNRSPRTDSYSASPAISKDYNRSKSITSVLRANDRCQPTMKSVTLESSSEADDLTVSRYQAVHHKAFHDSSCTSSSSSIPAVEKSLPSPIPASKRDSTAYVKESAPESPAAAAARMRSSSSSKGSRSQPALLPRAGSRSAKNMCRALCLQAMSVELTDDSTGSSISNPFTPYTSPSPHPTFSAPIQSREQELEFQKGRGSWLQKPKKLFKALK